jgi:NAD(P)H dehydrogenase (quinone)
MNKYLITGATGNLGGTILKQVLAQGVPADEIAVMVRKPEQAEKFKDLGVAVVPGDYFDYESLLKAFKTTEKLLLIGAPSLTGREKQHENILKAVKASGVKRVVYVGFIRPEHPKVNLTEVTDVEIKSEKDLIASGTKYTIMRNPLYSEALIAITTTAYEKTGILGGKEGGKAATAATADLAEATAKVLVENGHENKIYRLAAGENYTLKQFASLISDAVGKPVSFMPVTKEEYIASRAAAGDAEVAASYTWQFIDSIGKGDYEEASGDLENILGRKPESLKETIAKKLTPRGA